MALSSSRYQPTRELNGERDDVATHLSNTPSVSPTLPGPINAPLWRMEMMPNSQGMRTFKSANCATQLHNFMLTTGRLAASGCLIVAAFPCGLLGWSGISMNDCSLASTLLGRDDDVAIIKISARTAVNAQNAYWRTAQNILETDMSRNLRRFSLAANRLLDLSSSSLADESRPYRSRRDTFCSKLSSETCETISSVLLVCKTSAIFAVLSHSSQPSQAFPLMPFPIIISANISATSARRQPFSRSSVGSKTANNP